MLLFVAAALMTVLATTLPTLLLSWEVMGATSYALIGYHWRDPVDRRVGHHRLPHHPRRRPRPLRGGRGRAGGRRRARTLASLPGGV